MDQRRDCNGYKQSAKFKATVKSPTTKKILLNSIKYSSTLNTLVAVQWRLLSKDAGGFAVQKLNIAREWLFHHEILA